MSYDIIASNQGLHSLSLIEQFLDTSPNSKIGLIKFLGRYDKVQLSVFGERMSTILT